MNLHVHTVHLEGVFNRGAAGALRFLQATPTLEDNGGLVLEIGRACERWRVKDGSAGDTGDATEDEEDVQAVLQVHPRRRTRAPALR